MLIIDAELLAASNLQHQLWAGPMSLWQKVLQIRTAHTKTKTLLTAIGPSLPPTHPRTHTPAPQPAGKYIKTEIKKEANAANSRHGQRLLVLLLLAVGDLGLDLDCDIFFSLDDSALL